VYRQTVPTIIRLEDGVMKLRERLVTADFNRPANHLVGELLAHGPARQEDGKHAAAISDSAGG
jgi:hypothetical protein